MDKIAIIGAGQLGSRHLQGVKLSENELDIWVVDPCKEALEVAYERYNQIESKRIKSVHFLTDINKLPEHIDIAIIASGSKPRFAICKQLLAHSIVNYLILEKFLFTSLNEYVIANELFKQKSVKKVWVNCPRRLFSHYIKINSIIDKSKPVYMSYCDKNWGMCCNSIHMIDIFMMLCGENTYDINLSGLFPEIKESKRKGYIELFGTEKIETPNGSMLNLTCYDEEQCTTVITIQNGWHTFIINEGQGKMYIDGLEEPAKILFQSQLSGSVIDSIIETGDCGLTTFEMSSEYHKVYLNELLCFYNELTGANHDSCPIT